jgi:UPF0042 nucleotide-binding protein
MVLVSGLSGSGKSTALRALEDLGCYCVDNLPAALLKSFAMEVAAHPNMYSRVGLGIDARSRGPDLAQMPNWLNELKLADLDCQLLFLTADEKAIIKRFSETRRRHPLTSEECALPQAITTEIAVLEPLRRRADWVIDTSDTNIHELRRQVWKCVGGESDAMTIVLESFAFKRGVPQDVDFVFDARNLPNPHWEEDLRDLSGLDPAVQDWLKNHDMVRQMQTEIATFLLNWLPQFSSSQRSYITVGIGCTGGKHRSVFLVSQLSSCLSKRFDHVMTHHRELQN